MSLKKLFLAESMFCLREVFLDEERKIPGNPEIPEVSLARRSLTSDIARLPAGDGNLSVKFVTV